MSDESPTLTGHSPRPPSTTRTSGPTPSTPRRPRRWPPWPWLSASSLSWFGVVYWIGANTQWEAATIGVGLLALGFGVTAWGKYLMPQGPFVEERHEFHSTEAERQAMTAAITERGGIVVKRRKMLGGLFALGSTAMGIVLLFPLRSGPRAGQGRGRR